MNWKGILKYSTRKHGSQCNSGLKNIKKTQPNCWVLLRTAPRINSCCDTSDAWSEQGFVYSEAKGSINYFLYKIYINASYDNGQNHRGTLPNRYVAHGKMVHIWVVALKECTSSTGLANYKSTTQNLKDIGAFSLIMECVRTLLFRWCIFFLLAAMISSANVSNICKPGPSRRDAKK